MNVTSASSIYELRPKIIEKRERLQAAAQSVNAEYLNALLAEVDAALTRIDDGSYGVCETCHDPIEADRLARDPLLRFCLDHLSQEQRRAHEQDLELATQIQTSLLPARDIAVGDWRTHYRYQPAGSVGGDYCDVVVSLDKASLFFALGDVTGKGVAASLLMTHLTAIFRSLLSLDLPLAELMERANRLFCDSTPATHYATLVVGRTTADGVDLCNAGHCRPLVLRRDSTDRVDSGGLPLGLLCGAHYAIRQVALHRGNSLVLYSDGITEAQDSEGSQYDEQRLISSLELHAGLGAAAMADAVLQDVARFRGAGPQQDDMTMLVVGRSY